MSDEFFEDEAVEKSYDHRLMRRLLGYLRPYRPAVFGGVFLLLLLAGLEISKPWIIKKAIDGPIANKDLEKLLFWVAVYGGVIVLQFAVQYAQMVMTQWIGQKAMLDLRTAVFDHVMTMDMRFFDRNPVGRLLTRITSDINALNELFASGVVTIFGDVFMLIGIIAALLWLDVRLALVTFAMVPVLFLATWVFKRKARNVYREVRRLVARLNAFWQERITGIAVLQGFNQQNIAQDTHQDYNADLRGAHFRSIIYYATFFPLVELIGAVALALIIWYGGGRVLIGVMTFGALAAFIQYVERFYSPIRDLAEKYNLLQAAMASSERVFKLLDTNPGIVIPESAVVASPLKDSEGEVVFDHVWFAYNEGEWVLKDVSFTVSHGETVALVGATGAGKTSVANLIARLYEFQKGSITVNGVDVREWDPRELRRHVGTVSQDVFLFSGSIEENIRMGRKSLTADEVLRAAAHVGLDRLVNDGETGLDRTVGERGSGLSVGEKQLVAFSRVVADDPSILILDEATSSVDHATEARIQEALGKLFHGRTNIVVAHRLSTIRSADRIIVLHKGEIRETGTHEELIAMKGIYYYLDQLQSSGPDSATGKPVERMAQQ